MQFNLNDVRWISSGDHIIDFKNDYQKQALYLRKTFTMKKKQDIKVAICGLGYYDLYINGKKINEGYLTPAFSNYDKTVYFNKYKISSQDLLEGLNTICIILGNGWYNSFTNDSWSFKYASWREYPKAACRVYCNDVVILETDTSWKISRSGPIYFNELKLGEYYDARKEIDLHSITFNDSSWDYAAQVAQPAGKLTEEKMPPVLIVEEIEPVSIIKYHNKFVVDFGANLAGCVKISMNGMAGQEMKIAYAEELKDGKIYKEKISKYNQDEDFQTDKYIFKGKDIETWSSSFTYHGFRYCEISGVENLEKNNIKALFKRTGFKTRATFECDNKLISDIYKAGLKSFECNYHSIPTDCPHREKNGWTGDAQLSCEQSVIHYEMLESYKKYVKDICDCQKLSGQLSGIAPTAGWGYNWGSGPAWDCALFEIPYKCYLYYGDKKIMQDTFKYAKKYFDYMISWGNNDLFCYGLGDWCAPQIEDFSICDNTLSDSIYCAYMSKVLAEMAKLSGKDASRYLKKSKDIFNSIKNYCDKNPNLINNITALSLILQHNVYEDLEYNEVLAEKLNMLIVKYNYKMMVGILGARHVLHALTRYGYFETAFKMLENTEYPSFGYWIKNGATTFHEDWESSFSLNHHMYSDVVSFIYQNLSGIKNTGLQHEKVEISPHFTDAVNNVKASLKTKFGLISVNYNKSISNTVNITIPDGITAKYIDSKGKGIFLCNGVNQIEM